MAKKTKKVTSSKREKVSSEQKNIEKLRRTNILMNFVRDKNGIWGHEEWLDLCDRIEKKGYTPINFDHVGLTLEEKKQQYLFGE